MSHKEVWDRPQANRLFCGPDCPTFLGCRARLGLVPSGSRGGEPLEKGEPRLTLQANPPQWDAIEREIRGKARGPSKSTE